MDSMSVIAGNLSRDPDLRYTPTGKAVTSLGVAVNRRFQVSGEWQEEVSFFNVVAWGDLGENVAQCLAKGDRVVVTGRITQRSYEDKDGGKRGVVEIIADEVSPSLKWATAKPARVERDRVAAVVTSAPAS